MRVTESPASVDRVVIVGSERVQDRPGGLNRYVEDLTSALQKRCSVATLVLAATPTREPYIVVGLTRASLLKRIWGFWRASRALLLDSRQSILDIHFCLYGALPQSIARRRGTPVVVHFHGPWHEEGRLAGGGTLGTALKKRLESFVYRRADAVVTVSQFMGDVCTRTFDVEKSRITVIPPTVRLDHFRPKDRRVIRAGLGLDANAFVSVVARRLERRMGVDVLLEAWRAVEAADPTAILLIVGTGSEEAELRRNAKGLQRVRFLGRVDDDRLADIYAAADCSVVPSRGLEGFGLVVLESLACGTPVIASDHGGLPEALGSLAQQLSVPSEDPRRLASRLLEAAAGDLPSSEVCRARAESFGSAAMAQQHLLLYTRLRSADPT